MTSQPDYSKIYTHAPEQHPNLILGSLQLLFWMFFRPTAFKNHLKRTHPQLDIDTSAIKVLRRENDISENLAPLQKFIIQSFVILPILLTVLVTVIPALYSVISGTPLQQVIFLFFIAVGIGVVVSIVCSAIYDAAQGFAVGVSIGIAFGIASGAVVMTVGVACGVIFGITRGVSEGVNKGVKQGVAKGLAFGVIFGLIFGVGEGVIFGVAYSIVSDVTSVTKCILFGVSYGVSYSLGSSIHFWRTIALYPLLAAWSFVLYRFEQGRTDEKLSLLRFHAAFWDEWLYIPSEGLDKHLLLVMERNPGEVGDAMKYLAQTFQYKAVWQALETKYLNTMICVLEACKNVNNIAQILFPFEAPLESLADIILNNFQQVSEDTKAALKQSSNYNQRLVLINICEKLEAQIKGLRHSHNKYAPRFQPIAIKWRDIINNHVEELTKETEFRQGIDSPYIIGVPLTLEQQIFTGRDDIGTRIEQLLLDCRRPPLLLYGQRRMGKTSLLNNLRKLLPNSIIPMFVDLQGAPSSAKDSTGFLFNLAKQMINSAKRQSALTLPPLTRETLEKDPFTNFDEWLDKVEESLEQNTALLMLDEFEVLDSAIDKGRFDEEDVLGMLRHLIQHRPKFKVLIAGSHTIEEYQCWASYLINVQVVEVSYLLEDEARQLIENPIEDFTLRYEQDAVERILQLTRCHPFLVQLLCSELVAIKNEQELSTRRLATLADVEAAIPEALSTGSFFFADIQNNQVDATGLEILRFMAAKGEKAVVSKQTIALEFQNKNYFSSIRLLLQRELIEEVGNGYKFQVELIRRWFENNNI